MIAAGQHKQTVARFRPPKRSGRRDPPLMNAVTWTHWVWPMIAAALPYGVGMRVLARASRSGSGALPGEDLAWEQAEHYGRTAAVGVDPPEAAERAAAAWREAWRYTRLVDHADLFLSLTRSARWLRRHMDVDGAWPERDPFLAVTSHWGAGLWALRHLRAAGRTARFLSRRLDVEADLDPRLAAYARLRVRGVARALGTPLIYTGGAAQAVQRSWAQGESIVALFDVPPESGRRTISAPLGAGRISVPIGLLQLACAARIPVVTFAAGIDRRNRRRYLTIGPARVSDDPQRLVDMLARHLEGLLERDSAAWHLWPYAPALLER